MQTETAKPGKPKARAARSEGRQPFADEALLSQALDDKLLEWQRRGYIGFALPTGEWSPVLAAAAGAVTADELVFPGAREARVALFRGLPLVDVILQHLGLGRAGDDPAQSQAGHALPGTLADSSRRVAAPGGSPAAHLPHAVGAAMAAKALGRKEAVLALAGWTATETPDCHAALNFAAVFRAPVVFVFRGASDGDRVAERATAYGLRAATVGGDDPEGVRRELDALLSTARGGGGPGMLWVSRPAPLTFDAAELARDHALCDRAFAEAKTGRRPGLDSLVHGVFADVPWPLAEQIHSLAGQPAVPLEDV